MKAGAALGLLAGLGAINALRGGRDGTGPRFTGLLDMIDGGGAGQSGDKFEGGGLLSMLGNLFAKPIEAQRNVERIAQNTAQDKAQAEVIKKVIEGQLSPKLDGKDGLPVSPVISATSGPAARGGRRGAGLSPDFYDERGFERGSEPSVLSENERMRAAGILAAQAAMQPITQSQLEGGYKSEAPAALGISTMGGYRTPEAPSVQSDPMGLLSPSVPIQSDLLPPAAPQRPALDASLQRISGGVSFEQQAIDQLSKQIDSFHIMPEPDKSRLIVERAALLKSNYDQMLKDQVMGLGM